MKIQLPILHVRTKERRTGDVGEAIAARYLRRNGYRIIERNFVAAGHEIDIIAENKDTLIFAEVKTRTAGTESPKEPRPASAVDRKKRNAVVTAAKCYIITHRPEKKVRLDVLEVYLRPVKPGKKKKPRADKVVHMPGAFSAEDAILYPKKRV